MTAVNELKEFEKAQNNEMHVGDSYYVISAKWLNGWETYARSINNNNGKADEDEFGARPEEIDNEPITSDASSNIVLLKENLQEKLDYKLLTEAAWKLLQGWYG